MWKGLNYFVLQFSPLGVCNMFYVQYFVCNVDYVQSAIYCYDCGGIYVCSSGIQDKFPYGDDEVYRIRWSRLNQCLILFIYRTHQTMQYQYTNKMFTCSMLYKEAQYKYEVQITGHYNKITNVNIIDARISTELYCGDMVPSG